MRVRGGSSGGGGGEQGGIPYPCTEWKSYSTAFIYKLP